MCSLEVYNYSIIMILTSIYKYLWCQVAAYGNYYTPTNYTVAVNQYRMTSAISSRTLHWALKLARWAELGPNVGCYSETGYKLLSFKIVFKKLHILETKKIENCIIFQYHHQGACKYYISRLSRILDPHLPLNKQNKHGPRPPKMLI